MTHGQGGKPTQSCISLLTECGWERRWMGHECKKQSTIPARNRPSPREGLLFPLRHVPGRRHHPCCCKAHDGRDRAKCRISPASAVPPRSGFIWVSPRVPAELRSCPKSPSSTCVLAPSRNPTTLFWMRKVVRFCTLCRQFVISVRMLLASFYFLHLFSLPSVSLILA